MKVVYGTLSLLSIVGRTAIFLGLVLGLLALSPLIFLVAVIDSLRTKLRNSSPR